MCGICGIWHRDASQPVDPEQLARMSRTLRHRGPDDEGVHIDGPLGLAHRRLSIVDLSPNGRQPMSNEDGRLWIVFNGMIYNYLELREPLAAGGHRFRSQTDTEAILHLYEDEGPACVRRLNGMFAFAVWDARERTLFAARDRFGVKPFYYAEADGAFLFGSEIKALLASGLVAPRLNPEGLADYLTFQFCLGDKTLFRGVRRLPPGHTLTVGADGAPRVAKYWDLDFDIDTAHDEAHFAERLRGLLEDTARLQLRADVPLGAHLSGGLDSSTVVCLAAAAQRRPIRTFTGGFREGPAYDETGHAAAVARHVGAEPHEVFPTPQDFVDTLPRLMWHMDEPAAGPGVFPQYIVSRLAREHVKVVLGGQGGDEVFGGYTRYLIAYLEQCLKGGIQGTQEERKFVVTFDSILPNLGQLRGYEPLMQHAWREGLFGPEDRRYFRLIDRSERTGGLIDPGCLPDRDAYDPYEAFRELFTAAGCRSLINKMTWFDMKTLLPALLQVEDRTSMAVGLESRVPLLDHRIAELVASMPPGVKYKGGRSKHIFRRAIRGLVPEAVERRTDKMGFPVPLNEWYRREPVRGFVRDVLLGPRARGRRLYRAERIEPLLDDERPYGRGLWGMLCLELWMQAFFDHP